MLIMELIHEGARQRLKIENETFNTLKIMEWNFNTLTGIKDIVFKTISSFDSLLYQSNNS